jgi:hypothetical protein
MRRPYLMRVHDEKLRNQCVQVRKERRPKP